MDGPKLNPQCLPKVKERETEEKEEKKLVLKPTHNSYKRI